jgi:hypothetical protein
MYSDNFVCLWWRICTCGRNTTGPLLPKMSPPEQTSGVACLQCLSDYTQMHPVGLELWQGTYLISLVSHYSQKSKQWWTHFRARMRKVVHRESQSEKPSSIYDHKAHFERHEMGSQVWILELDCLSLSSSSVNIDCMTLDQSLNLPLSPFLRCKIGMILLLGSQGC